jgi:outer membrane immunogenic protein
VLGIELGYDRPSSLETTTSATVTSGSWTSTYRLQDYWTLQARAGYVVGAFLPYAAPGAAVGRVDYSTTSTTGVVSAQSNTFPVGFVLGLEMDVSVLPDVFLLAEWEEVIFQPEGGIRSSVQTARVGIGLRF